MPTAALFPSPLGPIVLEAQAAGLSGLYFLDQPDAPAVSKAQLNALPDFQAEQPLGAQALVWLTPSPTAASQKLALATNETAASSLKCALKHAVSGSVAQPEASLPPEAESERSIICWAADQLAEYFAGQRQNFDLPIVLVSGTAFQNRIWTALQTIPYGQTLSYAQLACSAGFTPQHSRPVGTAVGRNPITIILPCHRVVGSDGTLHGYTGGLHRKQYLLQLEGAPT